MGENAPKYNLSIDTFREVQEEPNVFLIDSGSDFLTFQRADGTYVFLNRQEVRRIEATPVEVANAA